MKMRAEINWIIPDIMTNTAPESYFRDQIVGHQSPQFFDEKDDQRKWNLNIQSLHDYLYLESGEKTYTVCLYVNLQQPKSVFAATYFIVVSDEKGDQPRQLISTTGWIQQDLENIFKHQSRSDICFIIDGHELRAHRLILFARSPVFAAMINKAEAEDELMNRFQIDNVSFMTFKELIHFMYTDQVVLSESNVDSLLAAAQDYSIPLLINKCEEYLYSTSLTVENCCEKLISADVNKSVHLKKMVVDYIRSNSAEVTNTNGWIQLKKSYPDLVSDIMEDIV